MLLDIKAHAHTLSGFLIIHKYMIFMLNYLVEILWASTNYFLTGILLHVYVVQLVLFIWSQIFVPRAMRQTPL